MSIIELSDKQQIAAFLRRNLYLNIYQLGDLDDFFWPHTRWWGWREQGELRALVLLYTGLSAPTVLALADRDHQYLASLTSELLPRMPDEVYIHYTAGLEDALASRYKLHSRGEHLKMGLTDKPLLRSADSSEVEQLSVEHESELNALYAEAYPGNWFDRRMLETERYFGLRRDGALVSVAGVHVVSREFGVAALGNITTHPDWRGKGLAQIVTAKVCQVLHADGCEIGLNVKTDNIPAIRCYEALGFTEAARYQEALASSR